MAPRKLDGRLAALAPPAPGDGMFEPHAAIDPADPQRTAVVAVYPSVGNGLSYRMWCWRTTDGGSTWAGSRVVQALHDGEGVADPLIAYAPDGALVAVAMNVPKAMVDARQAARATWTRRTAPTTHERMLAKASHRKSSGDGAMICVARSEDHGQGWINTIVPNSADADKTALAIDRGEASPHRGNVYVAWCDTANLQVAFARSVDGGRTMEPATRIGGSTGLNITQLAVGPDGTVHLLWSLSQYTKPDLAATVASSIFHARSEDGGATFSEPRAIAEHGALDPDGVLERMGFISLAAAPSGALLLTWSEADALPVERGAQVRNTVRWIHTTDGEYWSSPSPLTDLSADVSQGLATVAATERAWYVLTYEAEKASTSVRIYAAERENIDFHPIGELASRKIGVDDVWLGGNSVLRSTTEVLIVGDYVGLVGAGSRLAAAVVLPESDDLRSTLTAYSVILEEGVD